MKRSEFLAILGFGQLPKLPSPPLKRESDKDPPICIGVIQGIPIEIDCPDESCKNPKCPLGHCAIPLYIMDLVISNGIREESVKLAICSICRVTYALPVPDRREEK